MKKNDRKKTIIVGGMVIIVMVFLTPFANRLQKHIKREKMKKFFETSRKFQ